MLLRDVGLRGDSGEEAVQGGKGKRGGRKSAESGVKVRGVRGVTSGVELLELKHRTYCGVVRGQWWGEKFLGRRGMGWWVVGGDRVISVFGVSGERAELRAMVLGFREQQLCGGRRSKGNGG